MTTYTVTFDGRDFQASWNRLTYTFPACLCVNYPGECPWSVKGHKPWSARDTFNPPAWTRDMVDALMTYATSGKVARPAVLGDPPARRGSVIAAPKGPKSDPSPEKVAKLQALCDAAAARGGA